jgi:hypothetical protein
MVPVDQILDDFPYAGNNIMLALTTMQQISAPSILVG